MCLPEPGAVSSHIRTINAALDAWDEGTDYVDMEAPNGLECMLADGSR